MSQQAPEPEPEPLNLSPSKETYQSIQSDVTPVGAIKELIDNAIDNWERVHGRRSDLKIDITYDSARDLFRIVDNSGGLEEENIGKLFALGESTKEEIDTPIGAYGVGAKKAIVKLGRQAKVRSRHENQEYGYGFEIDEDWLQTPDEWTVLKQPYPDLTAGETVIEIHDLKLDLAEVEEELDDIVEAEEYGDQEGLDSETFVDGLRQQLSQTYEKFLKPSGSFDGSFTIQLNGRSVPRPDAVDWSFTPFDGFHPRSYDNITLQRHNLDHEILLTIHVGLMATADEAESGTDLFCQQRKVISGNSGAVGGYGFEHAEDIGELGPGRGRLKVRLFFETEGDADRLPWDTKKNDVDEFDSLMQEAYEWFNLIVEPYWRASRYDSLPRAFVAPYGRGGDQLAHGGHFEHFSYKGRNRHTERPNDDFEAKDTIQDIVNHHLKLGISVPQLVDERYRPTYRSIINGAESEDINDEAINGPVDLPDCPIDISRNELTQMVNTVREKVKVDANNGRRRATSGEWWEPLYIHLLEYHSGQKADSLPLVEESIDAQIFENETDSGVGDAREEQAEQAKLGSQSQSSTEASAEPRSAGEDESGQSASDMETGEEEAEATDGTGVSGETEESASSTNEKSSEGDKSSGLRASTRNQQGPDSPTGHRVGESDRVVVLEFDPDTWEDLCEYLGVETDADSNYIENELEEAIKSELLGQE